MTNESQVKEILQVVVLCIIWYIVSSGNGVIGKIVLSNFPYPMTVTLVQLMAATFCSGPLFSLWDIKADVSVEKSYYLKLVVPLALGKCFSSVSSHISIWKVPVSYAHTVKATMPLFTVVLSRLIIGEKQTLKVYLSLIPIIVGVLIATYSEISFNMIGLISALFATIGFSLQNIFSKKVLSETKIHHLQLLFIVTKLALMFFLPLWILFDARKMMSDDELFQNMDKFVTCFLLALDGACNFAQNIVAFSILSLVSPLTYSVCNATKRISVVLVSILLLGNPVTSFNCFGMMLAIVGVLGYNKAKYDANQEKKKKEAVLPYSTSNGTSLLLKYANSNHSPMQKLHPFEAIRQNGFVHHHNGMTNLSRTYGENI